jgi:hypothetical protein
MANAEQDAGSLLSLFDLQVPSADDAGLGPCIGDDNTNISDRRVKHHVTRIGITAMNLPLYRFSYVGLDGVFEGVMAQDVMGVLPEAVAEGPGGILRVNYEKLGIAMRRVG